MTRIAALNDFNVGSSDEEDAGPTREVLEAEATKNYNEAIRHLACGNLDKAYDLFCLILKNPYIEKASWPDGVEPGGTLPQDLALRYSCLKNLGNLACKRGEYEQSVDYYIEAVKLDNSDVTLWQRLGAAAIKLRDFELALVAFQEGYNVNPKHWPCLDQLLSVLFILKMYMDCLGLAIYTLQRDPGYIKALAFKDKIFELQPSLKEDVKLFFKDSTILFKAVDYDKAKGDKFISTCETLRPPNKTPPPPVTIPNQNLRKPLGDLTWDNLAQSLLSTYDALMEEDGMAFAGKIDVYEALNRAKSKVSCKEMEDLGVAPIENGLDLEGNEKNKGAPHTGNEAEENLVERDKNSTGDDQGNPIRITGRRRTIELGESQDSFRVSEKRRSIDSDSSRSEDIKPEDKPIKAAEAKDGLEEIPEKSDHEGRTEPDHEGMDSGAGASDAPKIKEEEKHEDNAEGKSHSSSEKQSEENSAEKLHDGLKSSGEEGNLEEQQQVGAISTDAVEERSGLGPVVDGESDNDFQGFTNAADYKDRHLKLMQEKRTDTENVTNSTGDYGTEVSYDVENPINESQYPGKEVNETVISDEGNIMVAEQRDGESQIDETNNALEKTESHEETDVVNEGLGNEGEVCAEKNADVDVRDEDENMHVEENEPLQEEEQFGNEDNRVDEVGQEEKDAGECVETDGENLGMEANDGDGIEENEECIVENEGYTEENIEEAEEGELVENEGEMEEMEDVIEEGNEGDENVSYQEDEEVEEGMEDDGFSSTEVTETEAAVNALKGIMALQPTEILGLPEPDFDYENEYAEYFDGGVYEEEEEEGGEDMDESMDQGEHEQQDEQEYSQEIDESQQNTEQEGDVDQACDTRDGPQQDESNPEDAAQHDESCPEDGAQHNDFGPEDDGEQGGDTQDEIAEEDNQQGAEKEMEREDENKSSGETDNNQKETSDTEKQTENHDKGDCNEYHYRGSGNEGANFGGEKEDPNTNTNSMRKRYSTDAEETTTETSDKTDNMQSRSNVEVARKSKRTKRGLERELEQLDYWGRRQERDAKRRRRTISSKLLGAIEEAEYLTWADLLRSFVPTALLTVVEEKKNKSVQEDAANGQTPKVESVSQDTSGTLNLETSSKTSAHVVSNDNKPELKTVDTDISVGKEGVSSSDVEKSVNDSNLNTADDQPKDLEKVNEDDVPPDTKPVLDTEEANSKSVCGKDGDQSSRHEDEIILSQSAAEEEQVQAFLVRCEENGGILHLLQQFLRILLKRHRNNIWPLSAAKMFTAAYPRVRNHVSHASPLNLKENIKRLYDESMLSLTHWELCSSIYQSSKHNTPAGNQEPPPNPFTSDPNHLEEDMFRLMLMLGRGDVWVEETPQFHTRLRWLQAQIRLIRGQPDEAASYLELLSTDLDRLAGEGVEYICNRARVESDTVTVCSTEVKRQLNVLQRSHMLEQVVRNYTDGRYREVADLLTSIFHEPLPKSRPGVDLPIRQTQLAILIDSLYKLSEYKDVMSWGSQALTEALMRYNRAEAEEEKSRWAKTLTTITNTVNTMLTNSIKIVDDVDQERMVELVSTLIQMLVVQLDKPQSAPVLPFECLTPWMLLHRLLSNEESRNDQSDSRDNNKTSDTSGLPAQQKTAENADAEMKPAEKETTNEEAVVDVETVPIAGDQKSSGVSNIKIQDGAVTTTASKGPITPFPSTLFLITAHEELGKHSWCCYDEGAFLLYCLDALLVELRRSLDDQHRQLLHHALEQVTFCLYSHPSKKSKHKHLRDHGVPQIAFCWERAMQLYQYYRPNVLPDFQSSQIPSITDDAAVLFKRIIALLPDDAKPANQTAGVEAYINGEVAECNYTPFAPPTDIIIDCFYLLGDYYFKSKEWTNAIYYYKLDLSINHERLESWAPLGLAMKAMLESQLNSCEVIEDEEAFFSLAKAAVQCLRQALKLDPFHTNLWVEFGGLVYMVHSHASRLLKQDLNPDISLETFDMLEKLKSEMLNQAEVCFTRALSIQEEGWDDEGLPDERWLHCYMLGKVSEKMSKPPAVTIQYYIKAARYLHNIKARYPTRINYNSPQEYSVEALEMYYRVHAFILKYLHQREGRDVEAEVLDTFTKCLDELAAGPFANCREKKNSDDNGLDASASSHICAVDNENVQKKRLLEDQETVEPPAKKLQSDIIPGDDLEAKDKKETQQNLEKKDSDVPSKGESEGLKVTKEKEKKESDDEIQVVEEKVLERKKDHFTLISRCLSALTTCLSRFHENYKTMYRLSYYYHTSKFHKDNGKAQNFLLGCAFWQNVGYMPVNGLFHERKVWIQQPRNCNFFHGVWRIPNDEIDRPGSFAAHMYRCISLILDILPQAKDFFMILQIALALKNSPDKDKKYLRDNERELLSEHATQVGLQVMKDKYKAMFKGPGPVNSSRHLRFLLDVYRGYKQISKHLPGSEPHFAKMLTDAYASYKDIKVENRSNVLREADSFCTRQQYVQHRNPVSTPSAPNFNSTVTSTLNTNQTPVVGRRGRPPLTNRGRGRGRGFMYNTGRTVGDLLAVQQAYKIYENLLNTQKMLAKKDLTQNEMYSYQKQVDAFQSQLMKYLTIPSVSHYFTSSLQAMDANQSKLPPPKLNATQNPSSLVPGSAGARKPPDNIGNKAVARPSGSSTLSDMVNQGSLSVTKSPSTQAAQLRPSISSLAARSQAHGISITSVPSSKVQSMQNKPLKTGMSVTVSQVKSTCPPALKGRDISVISVSPSSASTKTSSLVSVSKPDAIRLPSSCTTAASSSGISSYKSVTASTSGSSVPKLPAGTTITRPQNSTPNKGSGPRPQLQANPRIVKNIQPDVVATAVRKAASQDTSGSSPVSKANEFSSTARSNTPVISKPTLPKGMSITPAPRIKTQSRPPASSPSTSFLRAFEASLGLNNNKGAAERPPAMASSRTSNTAAPRPAGHGQTTSVLSASGKVAQLSTHQLLTLAYADGSSTAGRGSGPSNTSSTVSPYTKFLQQQQQQQQKVPSKQSSSSQLPQGSTLSRTPQSSLKSQASSSMSQLQASGTQQQFTNPQPPRMAQQSSNPDQTKSIHKPSPSKPPQKPSNTSDDIITLD